MTKISEMKISELFAELMQSRASWRFSCQDDVVRIGIDAAAY